MEISSDPLEVWESQKRLNRNHRRIMTSRCPRKIDNELEMDKSIVVQVSVQPQKIRRIREFKSLEELVETRPSPLFKE